MFRSTDSGKTWSSERPREDGKRLKGVLSALVQTEDGTLIAAGSERVGITEGSERVGMAEGSEWVGMAEGSEWVGMAEGSEWVGMPEGSEWVGMPAAFGGVAMAMAFEGFGTGLASKLLDKVRGTVILFRSTDSGKTWSSERPKEDKKTISGNVKSIIQTSDGKIIAAGEKSPYPLRPYVWFSTMKDSPYLFLYSDDGKSWTEISLSSKNNDVLHQPFTNLIQTKEGILILTAKRNFPLISLTNTEIETLRNSSFPPDLILETEINVLLTDLEKFNETTKFQTSTLKQTESLIDSTKKLIQQLEQTVEILKELTNSLDSALRDAEPVREVGQIATRIAVIALLIYLVQILLNRYRYHIRLSKFYKGRAQALCLLIADGPNQSQSKISLLNELATTLTPETIGFDKIKETPTVFSSTILNDRK